MLPKWSPDLNPLDYCYHSFVNKAMMAEEETFEFNFKEKRTEYTARLELKAFSTPSSVVSGALRGLPRRLREVIKQKGGHIKQD